MRTAQEFYALRDQRTDSCLDASSAYGARVVSLSIDHEAAGTAAGQLTFLLSANLIARWCRHIELVAPHVAITPSLANLHGSSSDLVSVAAAIARAADPFISIIEGTSGTTIGLHVGTTAPRRAFRVGSDGWLSTTGDAVGLIGELGIGAVLAACVGVAWAFRVAIGDASLPESATLSLWNLGAGPAAEQGPVLSEADLGRLLLVGGGAVGSALAYLLPLMRVRAQVTVVDGDRVDVSNLNRSPLFTVADEGISKAEVTSAYLERWGMRAVAVPLWFDEAVAQGVIFRERPDIVVPAANEHGVRHAIQHHVPPLQVYGTTSRDWQAFLGRHIPVREDCLACRFPVAAAPAPVLACSTGAIATAPLGARSQDAALPFLSTASAALALAEILKAETDRYPVNSNFACLDFKGPISSILQDTRPRRHGCICGTQVAVWHRLNGTTRCARHSA